MRNTFEAGPSWSPTTAHAKTECKGDGPCGAASGRSDKAIPAAILAPTGCVAEAKQVPSTTMVS